MTSLPFIKGDYSNFGAGSCPDTLAIEARRIRGSMKPDEQKCLGKDPRYWELPEHCPGFRALSVPYTFRIVQLLGWKVWSGSDIFKFNLINRPVSNHTLIGIITVLPSNRTGVYKILGCQISQGRTGSGYLYEGLKPLTHVLCVTNLTSDIHDNLFSHTGIWKK